MKIVRLFILLGMGFISLNTQAQAVLSIKPNALNALPDSVTFNDSSVFVNIWIYNTGNQAIAGDSIYIAYSVDSLVQSGPNPSSGIDYPLEGDTIQPNDSIQKQLRFYFTSPVFHPSIGLPSVVVIWPIAASAATLDSANKLILIEDTTSTGINGPCMEKLKVYTDGHRLFIKSEDETMLKYVRIYDAGGALLQQQQISFSAVIPMDQYATGIYFAEITLADNRRISYKVIK